MKHELIYSEFSKLSDGSPCIKGVVIPPNLLTSGYEWREITSARRIEPDFSPDHVFRKFRLRLTREVSIIAYDTRYLPCYFGKGGITLGAKESTMPYFHVQWSHSGKLMNHTSTLTLYTKNKEGQTKRLHYNSQEVWDKILRAHPIKKSDVKKVRIVRGK